MAEEDGKSRVLLTFRANHSQIAKPRTALILKKQPEERTTRKDLCWVSQSKGL